MQFSNHRSRAARGSIVYLAVDAIAPSAVQPRQNFSPAQLEELSRSIAEYGVLSPLTVRPRQGGYELVAGERRLRAARMAGLSEVPCIVMELDLEEASFIALVENLQRNDLDFLEEARGIAQLIRLFGLSQEECARRLGKSQSAVANKLRLLRRTPTSSACSRPKPRLRASSRKPSSSRTCACFSTRSRTASTS